MTSADAPHARACCPAYALAALSPDELRLLDRWCEYAMTSPDAEPRDAAERAVVERYERLVKETAQRLRGNGRPA